MFQTVLKPYEMTLKWLKYLVIDAQVIKEFKLTNVCFFEEKIFFII